MADTIQSSSCALLLLLLYNGGGDDDIAVIFVVDVIVAALLVVVVAFRFVVSVLVGMLSRCCISCSLRCYSLFSLSVLFELSYNTNALLDSSYRLFSSSYCTKKNARVKRKMSIVASDVW